jgi:hypothetical protein
MKKPEKITINFEVEKVLRDYCFRREIDVSEFIEEAILEKIEKEELKDSISEIVDETYKEKILNEYILDEFMNSKKKH